MSAQKQDIQIGFQVFLEDGGDEVGAVRDLGDDRPEIIIYVENRGEIAIPMTAVKAVHYEKVILDVTALPKKIRVAMGHAHDKETL
jgi:hypothetical protein